MSNWRVERHYGFGAARIPLQAEFYRGSEANVRDGLHTVFSELALGGPVSAMRRVAAQTPAIVLGLLLLMAFVVTMTKDRSDFSPIEMVLLETPTPTPVVPEEPEIPLAELTPEPPRPAPIPEPVAPRPAPPPPRLAERKPPPPPVVKPRPRPRPAPVMPQIAKIEAPKPVPEARAVRAVRPVRKRSQPIDRPRVAIDQLETRPPVVPRAPERLLARATAPRPTAQRNTPRLAAPAAPRFNSELPPPREPTFRVATSRPTAGERPKPLPGLAPAPQQAAAAPPAPAPRQSRAGSPRPNLPRRVRAAAPALASVSPPTAAPPALPAAIRAARDSPRTSQRAGRRPAAELARASQRPTVEPRKLASRADRAAPTASRSPSGERPGVAGVPLGELAACITDREEDRLKQAVVAAVKTQKECVSRKGTYRFVETKNLNAFLMWIEKPQSRAVEDRCAELHYALECLQSASQHAAR